MSAVHEDNENENSEQNDWENNNIKQSYDNDDLTNDWASGFLLHKSFNILSYTSRSFFERYFCDNSMNIHDNHNFNVVFLRSSIFETSSS
jgi:hypothetical protein